MTRTHVTRRPGLSVLEVMTALFVAALGMLSLLSLFPLGAVRMGQALRDSRAAETVVQADTHMRLWWQKYVVEQPGAEDPAFHALDNPGNTFDPAHPFVAAPVASTSTAPSYPVALDPLGWQAYPGTRRNRLAGNLFPRRTMNWILTSGRPAEFSFRVATMMDDLTFNESALPYNDLTITTYPATPPRIERQGRYNWLAVIQRPVNANRHVADLKIAVFDGRPPGIAPGDAEQAFSPTGAIAAGTSQLILGGNSDHLRAGSWIMDGTLDGGSVRNAVWYRVQAIDRDTLPGNMIVDLQTPLIRNVNTNTRFYAFKGLLEVFDRPQLTPPGYKQQSP